jgi:hypothetical protein
MRSYRSGKAPSYVPLALKTHALWSILYLHELLHLANTTEAAIRGRRKVSIEILPRRTLDWGGTALELVQRKLVRNTA